MAAQRHADTVHNPGGIMDSPISHTLSIWLEGEKHRWLTWHINPMDANSCKPPSVNGHRGDQKTPRGTVGTMDGDEHGPNEPTEPPDEKEGGQGRDGEGTPTVENIEGIGVKGPRRADK
ncbi:hypothetical protein PAXRUDRAFT_144654 [Paxillus rubicundulus Ve08.2h10]|uniref:Uncharacterized protein n=1 Tax=Paxillus rubicundulus Ve08.2h10 TaxID=930991 RepID=A0A0D0E0W4_9AGAM|nr:hypothetical protein PAXRUDRAFT_144654 [Paxillus rubicundulus Ve08.2h10]